MVERETFFGSDRRYRLFTAVKYFTYALLCVNVYLFLQEELSALQHTFTHGVAPAQLIQVFAATIDTAAWVVLLLLFELETSVLDDSRIRGGVRLSLHGIRGVCYVAIVYAFTGYYAELVTLYQNSALATGDACSLLGQPWSVLVDLDEYVPLDAGNCAGLGAELYRIDGFDILADAGQLFDAQLLAWTDLINSGAWILVVVVLEIEVRMQLRGGLSERAMQVNKYVKFALYFTLFAAAAYWGVAGDFLDFWDAALWLFAFIFIELNVFEWQYETRVGEGVEGASATA
ncbi:hypothetical protein JYP50_14720 [Parahaliea mediterranea]|uniref:Shikimate kinase n=2 Tax=Parahaliea mediterranea TaxID=651086 RepID=A0A939DHB8_9GAMM|nr:hypothetical protein [Parahaliea mediterranea]MBN7797861.1 hypothetical protein [Parahaliea mediterranea]